MLRMQLSTTSVDQRVSVAGVVLFRLIGLLPELLE
jgi:hypothetical protein